MTTRGKKKGRRNTNNIQSYKREKVKKDSSKKKKHRRNINEKDS